MEQEEYLKTLEKILNNSVEYYSKITNSDSQIKEILLETLTHEFQNEPSLNKKVSIVLDFADSIDYDYSNDL